MAVALDRRDAVKHGYGMSEIATPPVRADLRIVCVIAAAHFTSHFFQLVLPPLFDALHNDLGLSYGQLGFMMTAFFSASAFGQVAAGFLVDRFGPQLVLPGGMALLAGSIGMIGIAPNYPLMLLFAVCGGLGNSVYHPADFSVLTARVSPNWLARAYSVHTVSGTLGWAAAPVTGLLLSQILGWRSALLLMAMAGVCAAAILAVDRADLRLPDISAARRDALTTKRQSLRSIISVPIVMAFLYFTLLAIALSGTQSFLPTMLPKVQNVSVLDAGHALTLYLLFNAAGSLIGGYLADLTKHHERIVGAGLAGAALLMLTLSFIPISSLLVIILVSMLAGMLVGLTIPSRDMLVRSATPPGATGKVFGFVYSGLDLGSLIAPAVIGFLLDRSLFHLPFVFISAALFITIILAFAVRSSDRQAEPGAAASDDHRLRANTEPALQRDQTAAQADRDNVGAAARP
jgi:MFS transporter, FSR family, fosmidomycin resistance protein